MKDTKPTLTENDFKRAARRLAWITGEPISHYDLARSFGYEV